MKKAIRYSFLILLILSCIVVVPGCLLQTYLPDSSKNKTTATTTTTTTSATTTTITTTAADTTTTTTTISNTTSSTTSSKTTVSSQNSVAPSTKPSERSFPNTLFIGDSRTDGLRLYGKLTGATFFCKQSMTAYSVLGMELSVTGVGTTTLSGLLEKKQFESVYLMLGINELYRDPEDITAKYKQIVDVIRQKQPNAAVIVQASLHVTEKKANESAFTNTRINNLNRHLATLADNKYVFFIDPNPAFDDEKGNMRAEYSKDGVHYYAKYYPLWSTFLHENRRSVVTG